MGKLKLPIYLDHWTEVLIKNKEGVVVINKFPKPPPIKVQPRVYVRSPQKIGSLSWVDNT